VCIPGDLPRHVLSRYLRSHTQAHPKAHKHTFMPAHMHVASLLGVALAYGPSGSTSANWFNVKAASILYPFLPVSLAPYPTIYRPPPFPSPGPKLHLARSLAKRAHAYTHARQPLSLTLTLSAVQSVIALSLIIGRTYLLRPNSRCWRVGDGR
jgi:hypothetical protein